ncbi:MAG: T9SS type A sorting domain-containing protein [Calditrichaeota bacterium]|nr:T9SS type A sorting domain-containing protein [Calditrichota bacterium]
MKKILFILVLFVWMGQGTGQVVIEEPIDVAAGLAAGTIQATVEPPFTNDSLTEVFDGNPLTEAALPDTNTVQITLHFLNGVTFSTSRVYFWNTGTWTLEVADYLEDLENQSGSYQRLVDQQVHPAFSWDSLTVSPVSTAYVRLTATNPQTNGVYLGEWELRSRLTLTGLYIYPYPPRVIPGHSLQLKVKLVDDQQRLHPYTLSDPLVWAVDDLSVATISEFGRLTGVSTGNTRVRVQTASQSLNGEAPVSVVTDFTAPRAETRVVKVALVLQNPVIDSTNNRRIHQMWGWNDPYDLISQLLEEFRQISHGVVDFQIVEIHDDAHIFTALDGQLMSVDTLAYYFTPANQMLYGRDKDGTLQNLAEVQGRVKFDYKAMCDQYDFGTKRNSGAIDEVWVYSFPFSGMYESQLMGPNAFWWNSPPIRDYDKLEKLLSVMGWNYERGVAEALHSFGHRMESAMWHAYGRWQTDHETPNSWELFTRIDRDVPGGAHVGNVHFPPNGQSDYDYGNTRVVVSYADNWKRYPYLLDQTRRFNCDEWQCSHLGYMRWWFKKIPHFQGVYEGVLNNWWLYAVDYEEAERLARELEVTRLDNLSNPSLPRGFILKQNWPNPFNPVTHIKFFVPHKSRITLEIFNVLGQRVQLLYTGELETGWYQVTVDGSRWGSGIYYYRLRADDFAETRKMLLLK